MQELMEQPSMQEFHLVLSAGKGIEEECRQQESSSITVVRRRSEADVIRQASLVITCGSLVTINECIYYGVPMVALSLNGEQPANADLIKHHGLGRVLLSQELNAESIAGNIAALVNDPAYAARLGQMKHIFHYRESSRLANRIIAAELKKREDGTHRQAEKALNK